MFDQILPLSLFIAILSFVQGDIRCYCNEASCITTGYMCKSSLGSCYSKFTYDDDVSTGQPACGCAETLSVEDRQGCIGGDVVKTRAGDNEDRKQWPFLMCCTDDMCNDMDIDIDVYINAKLNDSILGGRSGYVDSPDDQTPVPFLKQPDLWFKAAVIAVPIAGAFILILLVLLAVKMLRTDSRRHRHLMLLRHHHSLAKAQLYVTDHFCEKVYSQTTNSYAAERPSALCREVNIMCQPKKVTNKKFHHGDFHGDSSSSVLLLDKKSLVDNASFV